jgi:DNA mismatch repair protein MutL
MSKIKILPEQVANQIAAGEVVERPASVVKEFVENAIDAGACNLTVQVEGNGTRLIRIVDDGEGMDQDDVLLCLERHATSKLLGQEQLGAIRTLGFRGEAVPSIASVAMLTITSRPAPSLLGTRAEVRFGRVFKVHEMGCSRGTIMEVRDLFGNVPARRKFLKTAQTELSHIEEVVKNYALACPKLGIGFWIDGREICTLPGGADSPEQRLRRLLGSRARSQLVAVAEEAGGALRLTGYLLPPEEAAGMVRLALFVNGRAVRDRLLGHAVAEGMQNFLMKGRRPAGALFLELPPEEVDVNVHPAKQEVRFRRAPWIHQQVVTAVARAMAAYQQQLKSSLFELPATSAKGSTAGERQDGQDWAQPPLPSYRLHEPRAASLPLAGGSFLSDERAVPDNISLSAPGRAEAPISCRTAPGTSVASAAEAPGVEPADGSNAAARAVPFKLLGQLLRSYLLCESSSGLVVIDQHAAHERLLFEQLKKQFYSHRVASQVLLFPKIVNLRPEELELVAKYRQEIEQLGIELEEFGGGSFALKSMPALLAKLAPEDVLADIIGQYGLETGSRRSGRLEAILAAMACKAAIKAGQALEISEMANLLQQMHDTDIFSHCPHGRPVMKCFSNDEMKKWFHRT